LELQLGTFNHKEAAEFARLSHSRKAVQLRRWDDQAKVLGIDVPPLEHYRARLVAALAQEKTSDNLIKKNSSCRP
jgi:predicted HD phosphohydrolase